MRDFMVKKIVDLLRFNQRENITFNQDKLLPRERRDDDIYLVSYPKSGNTWISFILANIIVEKLGLDIEINTFNIHNFVPDIHRGINIPVNLGYFPFNRIIKSHSTFKPEYLSVFYILRDPRSVMVSYYKFLVGLGQFKGGIGNLIRDKRNGIPAWVEHVNGWLKNMSPSTRFRIFKYEDLKVNPEGSILSMAKLLGVKLSTPELETVIQKSSFEVMQKLEEETRSLSFIRHDKNFRFVREGKIDGWRKELAEQDLIYIETTAGKLMKSLGYE